MSGRPPDRPNMPPMGSFQSLESASRPAASMMPSQSRYGEMKYGRQDGPPPPGGPQRQPGILQAVHGESMGGGPPPSAYRGPPPPVRGYMPPPSSSSSLSSPHGPPPPSNYPSSGPHPSSHTHAHAHNLGPESEGSSGPSPSLSNAPNNTSSSNTSFEGFTRHFPPAPRQQQQQQGPYSYEPPQSRFMPASRGFPSAGYHGPPSSMGPLSGGLKMFSGSMGGPKPNDADRRPPIMDDTDRRPGGPMGSGDPPPQSAAMSWITQQRVPPPRGAVPKPAHAPQQQPPMYPSRMAGAPEANMGGPGPTSAHPSSGGPNTSTPSTSTHTHATHTHSGGSLPMGVNSYMSGTHPTTPSSAYPRAMSGGGGGRYGTGGQGYMNPPPPTHTSYTHPHMRPPPHVHTHNAHSGVSYPPMTSPMNASRGGEDMMKPRPHHPQQQQHPQPRNYTPGDDMLRSLIGSNQNIVDTHHPDGTVTREEQLEVYVLRPPSPSNFTAPTIRDLSFQPPRPGTGVTVLRKYPDLRVRYTFPAPSLKDLNKIRIKRDQELMALKKRILKAYLEENPSSPSVGGGERAPSPDVSLMSAAMDIGPPLLPPPPPPAPQPQGFDEASLFSSPKYVRGRPPAHSKPPQQQQAVLPRRRLPPRPSTPPASLLDMYHTGRQKDYYDDEEEADEDGFPVPERRSTRLSRGVSVSSSRDDASEVAHEEDEEEEGEPEEDEDGEAAAKSAIMGDSKQPPKSPDRAGLLSLVAAAEEEEGIKRQRAQEWRETLLNGDHHDLETASRMLVGKVLETKVSAIKSRVDEASETYHEAYTQLFRRQKALEKAQEEDEVRRSRRKRRNNNYGDEDGTHGDQPLGGDEAAGLQALVKKEKWAQCDNCGKWRRLAPETDESKLPAQWYCRYNTYNPKLASCSAEEETEGDVTKVEVEVKLSPPPVVKKEVVKEVVEEQDAYERKRIKAWIKRLELEDKYMARNGTQGLVMSRPRYTTDWIQCCNPTCGKWRPLMRAMDGQAFPSKFKGYPNKLWFCWMNTWDDDRASCAAPQEGWMVPVRLPSHRVRSMPRTSGGSHHMEPPRRVPKPSPDYDTHRNGRKVDKGPPPKKLKTNPGGPGGGGAPRRQRAPKSTENIYERPKFKKPARHFRATSTSPVPGADGSAAAVMTRSRRGAVEPLRPKDDDYVYEDEEEDDEDGGAVGGRGRRHKGMDDDAFEPDVDEEEDDAADDMTMDDEEEVMAAAGDDVLTDATPTLEL